MGSFHKAPTALRILVVTMLVLACSRKADAQDGGTYATLNTVFYVGASITQWTGADIGAQINSAYAACPATGCKIVILPRADGTCYQYTTPIELMTPGKYAALEGTFIGNNTGNVDYGSCLNYTPTTATTAIRLDYSPSTGGGYVPPVAVQNLILENNACTTAGGCGSSAIGISTSSTMGNGGVSTASYRNVKVSGFSTGINLGEPNSLNFKLENVTVSNNNGGINVSTQHESVVCVNCTLSVNQTGITAARNSDIYFFGGSIDSNSVLGVDATNGWTGQFYGVHWENMGQPNDLYLSCYGGGTFNIVGGYMLDDNGGGTSNQLIQAGNCLFHISGLQVNPGSPIVTNLIANTQGGIGKVEYIVTGANPNNLQHTCSVPNHCEITRITTGGISHTQ